MDDRDSKVSEARLHRSIHASALVGGSVNLNDLLDYRRWLAVSRLLGDIDDEEAEASLGRAQAVYTANTSRAVMQLPPHLEPPTRT